MLSLQLHYRVLVNLLFCSTIWGSPSIPTQFKNTFSSLVQTFLKASLSLAPLGKVQPLREWQLHCQEKKMNCLKQHVSLNELKSCTQPEAGHHGGIAGWQSAKQQLALCFSCSAPSLCFFVLSACQWHQLLSSASQPTWCLQHGAGWALVRDAEAEGLVGGESAELKAT